MDNESILEKIEEAEKQREQITQQANNQIGYLTGRIETLKELLNNEKELELVESE